MNRIRAWWSRLRLLGPVRLRSVLLVAALAATAATLLTSLPAWADPTPTPGTATAPAPVAGEQGAPSPEQQQLLQDILTEQSHKLTPDQQQAALAQEAEKLRKLLPAEGGVLSVFNVTDRSGIPIEAYTVKSDTGGISDWDLGLYNLLTELSFMATKWLIAFSCWLIAWALSFGLAKVLLAPVTSVATSLHTRVVVEMGLPSLALAVCALICVARLFFGDRARGWGDAALSILLAALTTTMLASPPTLLMGTDNGAIAAARGLALEVADIILQANPTAQNTVPAQATSADLARPLTDALTDSFIVQPAMLLQYGQVFDGDCAKAYTTNRVNQLAYDRALADQNDKLKKATDGVIGQLPFVGGLVGAGNDTASNLVTAWAADHFGAPPMERFEKKCVQGDIGAAKKADPDKVGGALFLLIAALIVAVLIAGLAGSFLTAQVRIAWDAIRGESALVAGTIPGAGRSWLWNWCSSVLRSLAQMLVSVIALAVFIVVIQAVLTPAGSDWGKELTLRFLAVDIVCIAAVKQRRRLADRSRQVTTAWRTKMSGARVGGTGGSIFAAPASTTVAKRPQVARTAARVLVRSAMAGASLAHGNPLAAIGYAMPQSIGATALMSRLATGPRHGPRHAPRPPRPARPAGQPRPVPAPQPAPPPPPAPQPPVRPRAPQLARHPRPARLPHPVIPPQPAATPATPTPGPRQVPVQPPASARQQQLRQRLDRTNQPTRTTPDGRPASQANRTGRAGARTTPRVNRRTPPPPRRRR